MTVKAQYFSENGQYVSIFDREPTYHNSVWQSQILRITFLQAQRSNNFPLQNTASQLFNSTVHYLSTAKTGVEPYDHRL